MNKLPQNWYVKQDTKNISPVIEYLNKKYPYEHYKGDALSTYGYGEMNYGSECISIENFNKHPNAMLLSIQEFIQLSKEIDINDTNKYNIEVGDIIKIFSEFIVKGISEKGIHLHTEWSWKYTNECIENRSWTLIKKSKEVKEFPEKFFLKGEAELMTSEVWKNFTKDFTGNVDWYYHCTQEKCIDYDAHLSSEFPLVTLQEFEEYFKETNNINTKEIEEFPEKWQIKLSTKKINDAINSISLWKNGQLWLEDNSSYNTYYVTNDGKYRSEISTGYTEITFEQFKEHVLKQKLMGKEIIGYKLIKPEYSTAALKIMDVRWGEPKYTVLVKSLIKKLKDAGVLDLWFEPIYKEKEFKVGDIVKIIKSCSSSSNSDGDIGKITRLDKNKLNDFEDFINTAEINGWWEATKSLKLASPEEIKEYENNLLIEEAKKKFPIGTRFNSPGKNLANYALNQVVEVANFEVQSDGMITVERTSKNSEGIIYNDGEWAEILPSYPQITVNGYKGEFFDQYVKFGCAEISKQLFIDLHKTTKVNWSVYGNKNIESVTIGKGTFSKEQIKEIAEYYKNK